MAAVPIYVWNGTAWQETGPTIPASPIKYQASAPTSPSTGDIWVDSDADVTTGSQQFQRFRFVASGGETTISGNDANGATLAYTAGAELVVLNGSTLTSATSKILVMIAHGANQKETNNTSMAMRLYRGATSIAQIMVDGGKDGGTGRNDFGGTNINVLDEPATTSATTYKTQFMSQGNNAQVSVQTGNSLSTIILMEIGV